MAKVKAPLQSFSASGSVADTLTFRTSKNGTSVGGYSKPGSYRKTKASAIQLARRNTYSAGSRAWNSLYQSTKELFSSEAKSKKITGFNLFISNFYKVFIDNLYIVVFSTQTSAVNNSWYSVTWSPELGIFCAVAISGTNNRVMTSPDGITWTSQTSAANNIWFSVTWSPELGIFCAVASSGTDNRVMTSPDGITWTAQTSAVNNVWRSVTWSPELGIFCAVSISGIGNRVTISAIYTKP